MTALHPLASSIEHPAPLRAAAPPWLLITGLFAAPTGWGLQLLVSYGLEGDICHPSPPLGGRTLALALIGIAAVIVCLVGVWSGYRTWRLTRGEAGGDHHDALTAGVGRTRFLGLGGMIAAIIFAVGSMFGLLVPLLESPCAVPF